ncbi:MAG: hypothetical protein OEZ06_22220 [Myxococcales bacterium]|nr:hypothetical protein [Myxococcales bacterium]
MTTKLMLGVIAGVFVGAFALEVMSRKQPALLAKVGERARLAAGEFTRAFMEGYRGELPSSTEG